jgi:hypothetical protein
MTSEIVDAPPTELEWRALGEQVSRALPPAVFLTVCLLASDVVLREVCWIGS